MTWPDFCLRTVTGGPRGDGREVGSLGEGSVGGDEGLGGDEEGVCWEVDIMGLFISKNRLGFAAVISNPPNPSSLKQNKKKSLFFTVPFISGF